MSEGAISRKQLRWSKLCSEQYAFFMDNLPSVAFESTLYPNELQANLANSIDCVSLELGVVTHH